MRPLIDDGVRDRDPSLPEIDFAACLWVSLSKDGDAARGSLAEKIAYFGSARSPLILERLGLTRADFSAVDLALREERDMDKACSLVDGACCALA